MTTASRFSTVRGCVLFHCSRQDALEVGDAKHRDEMGRVLAGAASAAGFTVMGHTIGIYPGGPEVGYSWNAHIGQSALDIHTWNVERIVELLAHTCGEEEYCEKAFRAFVGELQIIFGSEYPFINPSYFLMPHHPPTYLEKTPMPPSLLTAPANGEHQVVPIAQVEKVRLRRSRQAQA